MRQGEHLGCGCCCKKIVSERYTIYRQGQNIQVTLDVLSVDLGSQRKSVHQELSQSRARLGLLVQNVADVVRDTLNHLENLLDGALQRLNIGLQHLRTVLSVLCARDQLETAAVSLAVLDLVGNGNEQAAVGSALGGDTNGSRDVGLGLNVLSRYSGDSQVNGGVGPGAVALLAVEVLDEGGEGVQVGRGGIPAEENFLGVCAEVQLQHLLLVVHVDLDLLLGLGVGNGVAVADLDFSSIFRADTEKSADNALLVLGSAERVVEDCENGLGLDADVQGRGRGLGADLNGAQRAGEMEERVLGHGCVGEVSLPSSTSITLSLCGHGKVQFRRRSPTFRRTYSERKPAFGLKIQALQLF